MESKWKKVIYTLIIGFCIVVFCDMYYVVNCDCKLDGDDYVYKNHGLDLTIPNSKIEIIDRCSDLGLEEMSNCFLDNVMTFFDYVDDGVRYTESADDKGNIIKGRHWIYTREDGNATLTDVDLFDYLRENGGICTEWALFYEELCYETEFDCDKVTHEGIENVFYGHQYSVMYNETDYCKLDQTEVTCGKNYNQKV